MTPLYFEAAEGHKLFGWARGWATPIENVYGVIAGNPPSPGFKPPSPGGGARRGPGRSGEKRRGRVLPYCAAEATVKPHRRLP